MKKYIIKFVQAVNKFISDIFHTIMLKNKPKIFCIGRNKTGTTSLAKAFKDLGFVVGNQHEAELLQPFYLKGDFEPIIKFCRKAQVFQDYPFSYPETFKHIDNAYPGSKFILSIRDTPEQWYNSLVNFNVKGFGNGKLPSAEVLKKNDYVYEGWVWNNFVHFYQTPEKDPYNKEKMINSYNKYNNSVIEYFKDRPNDLIIINLSNSGDYKKLMTFLKIDSPFNCFPWENKA